MKKTILFWSRSSVNKKGGTATIMKNLFTNSKYNVFHVNEKVQSKYNKTQSQIFLNFINSNNKFFGFFFNLVKFLSLPFIVLFGIYYCKKIKPHKILTVYNDYVWIISAFYISKICKIDLILYIHDLAYPRVLNWNKLQYFSYLLFEKKIFEDKITSLVVLTHQQKKILQKKFKKKIQILYFFFDYKKKYRSIKKKNAKKFIIGFSGTIHYDNLTQLIKLSEIVKSNNYLEMKLFVNNDKDFLKKKKLLNNKKIKISHIKDYQNLIKQLDTCDLLYLPFKISGDKNNWSVYRDTITSKSLDYLYSSSPILFHGPKNTFNFKVFKKFNTAYLMCKDSPDLLLKKICSIKEKKINSKELFIKKQKTINFYFNKKKILDKFSSIIQH